MANLTRKHSRQVVFNFIVDFKKRNDGNSPSLREIMAACGVSSNSVMKLILCNLEDAGLIRIHPGSRSIIVIGGFWSFSSSVLPSSPIFQKMGEGRGEGL